MQTVLYVEDEDDDIYFMRMGFKRASVPCSLQAVTDGKKAMAYLAGEPPYSDRQQWPFPSLILLDLNLPVRSGFEVLQWLRCQQEFQSLPVIIFSSSGREEDREKARKLGANDYILKPSSALEFTDIALFIKARWLTNMSA